MATTIFVLLGLFSWACVGVASEGLCTNITGSCFADEVAVDIKLGRGNTTEREANDVKQADCVANSDLSGTVSGGHQAPCLTANLPDYCTTAHFRLGLNLASVCVFEDYKDRIVAASQYSDGCPAQDEVTETSWLNMTDGCKTLFQDVMGGPPALLNLQDDYIVNITATCEEFDTDTCLTDGNKKAAAVSAPPPLAHASSAAAGAFALLALAAVALNLALV